MSYDYIIFERSKSYFKFSLKARLHTKCPNMLFRLSTRSSPNQGFCLQDAPFFTVKLQVKLLPCLIMFKNGVAIDRIAGFDELGSKDDFQTSVLERRLLKAGVIQKPVKRIESDDDISNERSRNVRTANHDDEDEDSDFD